MMLFPSLRSHQIKNKLKSSLMEKGWRSCHGRIWGWSGCRDSGELPCPTVLENMMQLRMVGSKWRLGEEVRNVGRCFRTSA